MPELLAQRMGKEITARTINNGWYSTRDLQKRQIKTKKFILQGLLYLVFPLSGKRATVSGARGTPPLLAGAAHSREGAHIWIQLILGIMGLP
jgi:hypothetical protein